MHTRIHFRRAATLGLSSVIAALVIMAPVTTSAQSTKAPRGGFGYGFQVQLWHYDTVARSNVIGDVTQAGFNWMKQQIDWQEVEVSPGQYDFSQLDRLVGDGSAAGLNIMLGFFNAPAFYRSATSGLMPADPSTFGNFMAAVAAQYAGNWPKYVSRERFSCAMKMM